MIRLFSTASRGVLNISLVFMVGLCGCGGTEVATQNTDEPKRQINEADYQVVAKTEPVQRNEPDPADENSHTETTPPESQPTGELVKADVDATGKGEGYGGDPVTAPIRALVRTRERVKFIEVDHALKIHRALNGDIKDTDQFMNEIVKANGLTLPDLPAGDKYYFDPKTQALMVEEGGK
jgi:hypothetical protein